MATSIPGQNARIRSVVGTEGDDRIVLETGTIALGNGGKDVFVVAAAFAGEESVRLGAIADFDDGDSLDLGLLGPKAAILGEGRMMDGSTRLSIDFDGDGREDGYLYVGGSGFIPADDSFGGPAPDADGEFHILPYPMPGDDEVMTILPFPMPGDGPFTVGEGEFHILPYPMPGDGVVEDGEFHILPVGAFAAVVPGAGGIQIMHVNLSQNDFLALMAA